MKLKPEQEQQALAILKQLPLFAGCSDEQIQALAAQLDSRTAAKGKVIMMDQEIGKTLYVIVQGSVGIWKRLGGEKKRLATLQAPDFVGERSMFEQTPASALVKAEEDCLIYALERPLFDSVVQKFPSISVIIRMNMEIVRATRITPATPPPPADPL